MRQGYLNKVLYGKFRKLQEAMSSSNLLEVLVAKSLRNCLLYMV